MEIRNRITFKNKGGYYFELSSPEITKLFEITKSKATKNDSGKIFLT